MGALLESPGVHGLRDTATYIKRTYIHLPTYCQYDFSNSLFPLRPLFNRYIIYYICTLDKENLPIKYLIENIFLFLRRLQMKEIKYLTV